MARQFQCGFPRKRALFALLLLTFCLRLAEAFLSGVWQNPLKDEPSEEVRLAESIAKGQGFVTPVRDEGETVRDPSAFSAPGYPYFLAGLLNGLQWAGLERLPAYRVALLVNLVTVCGAVLLLAAAAYAFRGPAGFWITGLLATGWPTLIRASLRLWETAFTILAIAVGVYLSVRPAPFPYPRVRLLGAALLLGLLALCNPVLLPFLGIAMLVHVGRNARWPDALRALIWIGAIWLLCLAPWLARNAVVFHRFIPVRNNFGYLLWLGNQPGSDGSVESIFGHTPFDHRGERAVLRRMGEDAYMRMRAVDARASIRADPRRFFRLTWQRIGLYWFGNTRKPTLLLGFRAPMPGGHNLLKGALNILLLVLAALGTGLARRGAWRWVCWFGVLYFPLPFYFTHVSPNYRVFVDPLLIALATPAIAALVLPRNRAR